MRFETPASRLVVYLVALAGLGGILAARHRMKPAPMGDFSVFYLGGRVAQQGAWGDLYPVAKATSDFHPGQVEASEPKPAYRKIAEEAGIENPFRYIYSPPSAILLIPFIHGTWRASIVTWWALMAACCWGCAVVSGGMYARVAGRRDWAWVAVILAVAWCPLTWATVRTANSSAASALMIGLTLWGLVARRPLLAGAAFYAGAALKFATIPLAAIPLLLGRYRAFAAMMAASAALTAAGVALTGVGVWREYLEMLPSLGRPNPFPVNTSATALIRRFVPPTAQPLAMAADRAAMAAALAAALYGLHRNRRRDDDEAVLAGASALLGWFLVFAPTTQNHYFAYLFPLWGYYAAEARRGWPGLLAALAVVGSTLVPINASRPGLPPLLELHMMPAAVAALAFGLYRLYARGGEGPAAGGGR